MNNPTSLIIIAAVLSCAAAAIILAVRNNRNNSMLLELHNAARKLVKEQNLNDSLLEKSRKRSKGRFRMIIALTWKDREKISYVFDPTEGVRIGRESEVNTIVIPDDEVSMRHCVLFRKEGALLLEDLRSTNGTLLIHGFRKKWVRGREFVYDGDKIQIGRTRIIIHVFWIDSSFL